MFSTKTYTYNDIKTEVNSSTIFVPDILRKAKIFLCIVN